jgi:hypothetical protein
MPDGLVLVHDLETFLSLEEAITSEEALRQPLASGEIR